MIWLLLEFWNHFEKFWVELTNDGNIFNCDSNVKKIKPCLQKLLRNFHSSDISLFDQIKQ